MQQIIRTGTKAVSIYSQREGKYNARLYVNCRSGVEGAAGLGDGTLVSKSFKTLKGAMRWAATILEIK